MAAPKGNQFWRMRSSHGAKPKFDSQEQLWNAACEYFEWVESHPLKEEKVFHFQGEITRTTINKMRAMTVGGLCLFLDISSEGLAEYGRREDFSAIVQHIKKVIYEQKFAGAAADLLNPNIIARDLGLTDRRDHTSSDGSMSPDGMTPEQRQNRINELLNKGK